jgi:adenosylhomocysteine nucleosidase
LNCIGIISALSSEGRCLTGKFIPDNKPVQINEHAIAIICGMGEDNARIAVQQLLEKNVTALVSWGTAGALTEKIYSGDLVLANSVTTRSGENYTFDTDWNKRVANELCNTSLKIHHGMIAHTEQVLKAHASKVSLQTATHAIAVDMESIAIARIAHKENLPCLAVRAIVDEASQSIPEAIINSTDMFGRPALFSLLGSIISKPNLISDLIHLSKGMKAATKTLNTIARSRCLFN